MSHPLHSSFFVRKLWSYFVPVAPDRATQSALEALYRDGHQVAPVLEAILQHPALYDGPRMVKPPIVHLAGLLRRIGAGITTTDWAWIGQLSGQQLFYPPNVAGWDDTRWLDTATYRGRWIARAAHPPGPQARSRPSRPASRRRAGRADEGARVLEQPAALDAARTLRCSQFAHAALGDAGKQHWKRCSTRCSLENALRQLIAVSPDLQTS